MLVACGAGTQYGSMWFVSFSSAVFEFEDCFGGPGPTRSSLRTGTRLLTTAELDRLASAMRSLQPWTGACVSTDGQIDRMTVTTPTSVEVLYDQYACAGPAGLPEPRFDLHPVREILHEFAGP